MYKMPFDRAGCLNNLGGFGSCGSNYNRINDAKLLKRELHFTETLLDTINRECASGFNNYGYGGGNCGFNDCGFGGCGPAPCGPGGFGGGFGGGCGFGGGFGGPFNGGAGVEVEGWGYGPQPFQGGFGGGYFDKDDDKKKEKKKDKKDDPCNPFCKPCYKPVCNNPKEKVCKCKECKRASRKIYEDY